MDGLHQHLSALWADPSGQPRKALLKVLVTCIALGVFALPQNTERSVAALTFLGIRLDSVQLMADLLVDEVVHNRSF